MWALPPIIGGVIILVVLAVYFLLGFLPAHYVIPQNGMYPGLPANSHVFAIRNPYSDPSQVARGDVVIFKALDRGQESIFIWRVVGLPGDHIQTRGDQVIVNGEALKREFVRADGDMQVFRETNGEAEYEIAYGDRSSDKPVPDADITLPSGQFFVMGDNRNGAEDSRYRGPIAFESIIAKTR
jgi:signal peptidase I